MQLKFLVLERYGGSILEVTQQNAMMQSFITSAKIVGMTQDCQQDHKDQQVTSLKYFTILLIWIGLLIPKDISHHIQLFQTQDQVIQTELILMLH